MKDYFVSIFYSEEDHGYNADIPDLEFCSAFGETPEAALHELMVAKDLWLQTAREHNIAIPEPRYLPVYYQGIPLHLTGAGRLQDSAA